VGRFGFLNYLLLHEGVVMCLYRRGEVVQLLEEISANYHQYHDFRRGSMQEKPEVVLVRATALQLFLESP